MIEVLQAPLLLCGGVLYFRCISIANGSVERSMLSSAYKQYAGLYHDTTTALRGWRSQAALFSSYIPRTEIKIDTTHAGT